MGTVLTIGVGCDGPNDSGPTPLVERTQTLTRDLTLGANGDDVRTVHEYLGLIGYFPNPKLAAEFPAWRPIVAEPPADQGVFDARTAEAVRRFQVNSGLSPTGIVDQPTRDLIKSPRCGVPDGLPQTDRTEKFAREGGLLLGNLNLTWKLYTTGVPAIGLANAT